MACADILFTAHHAGLA